MFIPKMNEKLKSILVKHLLSIAPTTPTDFKHRHIDTSGKDTPRLIQSFMFGLLRNI